MKFDLKGKYLTTKQNTQKNGIIYLCFLSLMLILGEEEKEELSRETI
jgi:hypothetical protein